MICILHVHTFCMILNLDMESWTREQEKVKLISKLQNKYIHTYIQYIGQEDAPMGWAGLGCLWMVLYFCYCMQAHLCVERKLEEQCAELQLLLEQRDGEWHQRELGLQQTIRDKDQLLERYQ